jgi:polygalacturonase
MKRHRIAHALIVLTLMVPLVSWAVPALPSINTTNVFNVNSYGASTTNTDNSAAIQAAINAASAAPAGVGGGTVEIPGPGTYLSGPLTFKSKVNLQIDSGATLMMLAQTNWLGSTTFILGASLQDVEISGSGTLDGQGAGWWGMGSRPNFIEFSKTHRILIQNVTMQNPPTFHMMLKGNNGDITIQGINIETDPNSPNTDGMDLGSTNMLIQNCHISDGDDNIEIGGSSGTAANITITNCIFGRGHGVSVGSLTQAGVSNVTVINCTFTNTDYAIRMKSDKDRGGLIQNMSYYNLGMTNIKYAPILIYSYYNTYGTPTTAGITPTVAAATAVDPLTTTEPVWRNIVISNVTATAGQPGMIWARTEVPATNITLIKLNITASGSFDLYNVRGARIVDSQVHVGSSKSFALFNAQTTFTNSATGASTITLDGASVTNSLALYNSAASLGDSTLFDANPITLAGSNLTDTTSLTLPASSIINFGLGSNVAKIAVTGDLSDSGTVNVFDSGGFGSGVYTVFTYTGTVTTSPTLGTTPPGFIYALTNGSGKVNLVVTSTCVNPTASVSGGGTLCSGNSVNIQASLTGTQPWTVTWSDGVVQSGLSTSLAIRSVSPAVSTNYTVTALSDSTGCPAGALSGSATVTVNAHPTASVSGGGTVCGGNSVNIQAALTGTQPWNVTWSDGVVQSGVTVSLASRSVSPPSSTNYTVTALSDATGCTVGTLSGNAVVTVCTPTPFQIDSVRFANSDQVVLTWDTVNGNIYQVLSRDDLTTGDWLTNATITATGTSASWTNNGVSGVLQRFYRVVNIP